MEPLSLIRKKPWPLTARSSVLLLVEMLPWVNCWATVATEAPIPTWVELPADSDAANTSANWAPACL